MIRILFLGDIFGKPGRQMIRDYLPGLVGRENIDLTVANAENASGGLGLNPTEARELLGYGLAVLTGGNHTFRFREMEKLLIDDPRLIRPANYSNPCPGRGWTVVETFGGVKVGVGNLLGRVFLSPNVDCPFRTAEHILREMKDAGAIITIIDFHAETTSEKKALACHLDGKVGALLGTHTHVPTMDAGLLPGGSAFQTDVGMCGPHQSIIGMSTETVLPSFLSGRHQRFEPASRGAQLNGAIIDFDQHGLATAIKSVIIHGPR